MIDPTEQILNVRLYKVPLSEYQLRNDLFYHVFVMYETAKYWWTIEKNTEGLTLQRSTSFDAVVNKYRQKPRCNSKYWEKPQLIIEDKGRRTLDTVLDWLWSKDILNKKYSWTNSNCKHFAKEFFDEARIQEIPAKQHRGHSLTACNVLPPSKSFGR